MHNTITCCVGRHKQRPSIDNINIEKLLLAEINSGKNSNLDNSLTIKDNFTFYLNTQNLTDHLTKLDELNYKKENKIINDKNIK
jgi:hypothetical protein